METADITDDRVCPMRDLDKGQRICNIISSYLNVQIIVDHYEVKWQNFIYKT
jgi:hypothetical protein